jgi:hypothetical protein
LEEFAKQALVHLLSEKLRNQKDRQREAAAAFEPIAAQLISAGGSTEALDVLARLIEQELGARSAAAEFKRQVDVLEAKETRPAHRPAGMTGRQRFIRTVIMATGGADLPASTASKVNEAIVDYLEELKPWAMPTTGATLRHVQSERKQLREDPQLLWSEIQELLRIGAVAQGGHPISNLPPQDAEGRIARSLLETLGDDDEIKLARVLLARTDEITR